MARHQSMSLFPQTISFQDRENGRIYLKCLGSAVSCLTSIKMRHIGVEYGDGGTEVDFNPCKIISRSFHFPSTVVFFSNQS